MLATRGSCRPGRCNWCGSDWRPPTPKLGFFCRWPGEAKWRKNAQSSVVHVGQPRLVACYLNEARHEISRRCRHRRSCCHGGRCASADRKLQSPGGTEEACRCCIEVVHDEVRERCLDGLQ